MSPAASADLILASTSRYRRDLLARLGLPFTCEAPEVDENAAKALGLAPVELARHLARAKAQAVLARRLATGSQRSTVVIGGDQLVALDGAILGKPGTAAGAIAQLERMAGRTHELITTLCVARPDQAVEHTDVTRLHVRDLERSEIERYVAADDPVDCAGSYKIECLGIALFDAIESADQTAITGLPMLALARILRRFGYAIP